MIRRPGAKAVVAGCCLLLVAAAAGYLFLTRSPVAVVKNAASAPVAVRLETDVGESYSAGTVAAGGRVRLRISGRDKLLWAVVQFSDGRVKRSEKTYTTTQGTVSILVTDDAVGINYAL